MRKPLSIEKRCPKCELVKSRAADFFKGQAWCKSCQKIDVYRWRCQNRDRALSIERASRARRRPKVLAYLKQYYAKNRLRELETARNRNAALKAAAYVAYGGYRCACCGEEERAFLSIDHVGNDGNVHRKAIGRGTSIYLWLKKNGFPPGFQVLCMNCNFGKRMNGGVCPHVEAQYGIQIHEV